MENPTKTLVEFLVETSYADFPAKVIRESKALVLDLLGVTLGASETPECKIILEVIKELGGRKEATIVGLPDKNSCINAALANSLMSHTLELDDTHRSSITHIGCVVIPAALSVAERRNSSGKEFLTSVVLGYECTARIALCIQPSHWERGFHSMGTCGSFGAAGAVGKILELNKEQMANALGLAGTQAGGLLECIFVSGDMSKRLNAGRGAANGVLAALLAEKGFTGPTTILEGSFGFCRAMSNTYDLQRITKRLGETYEVSNTSLKPYACCRYYHSAIDALFEIRKDAEIDPRQVEYVEIKTHEKAVIDRPHHARPTSNCDAQMSLPYSIAVGLLEGRVTTHEFSDEKIRDTKIHAMAEKVRVMSDPELTAIFPEKWSNKVHIVMKDGRKFERRVDIAKGEPENPMTDQEVKDKFENLVIPAVGESRAKEIIRVVDSLEQIGSICELTGLLSS